MRRFMFDLNIRRICRIIGSSRVFVEFRDGTRRYMKLG